MIKLKKLIPIFMFIFSIFLIGNNKVFADDSIQTINFPASSVARLLENASTKSLDFFSKDSSTYKYTINALNFINNNEYKQYGKYYFIDYFGDDIPLIYITDYPELLTIIAYDEDVSDGTRGHFTYHINYDSSKPIYRYKPSRKSYPVEISSVEIQDGGHLWGFAKTELEDPYFIRSNFPEVRIIGGRTLQLSDVSYSNSEAVFLGHQDGSVSLNKYSSKPQLNYKNSFISNEDYDKLGKVSIEFSENDENISKYNYAQFKLQYGSNDFKQENIPIFSHYKVFGKVNANTNWEEVDPKSISYNDEQMNLQVIDTSYDYVEGSLADSTVTVQMDFMKSLNSLYEIWKIEFYFDNTQNGYFYVADTLENSKWTDTSKFLENYIYYEFPNDKMYAFISSENENNSGKIYFPTNSIENEEVKINFKYFDRKSNTYDSPIPTKIYDNDDYYSYIDFKFNNKEKILSVNRNKGSHVVKTYGTDILNFYKSWLGLNKKIIPNEITYFYVPIGYKIYFSNGKDVTQVITSEGYVDIDNSTTTDYFNSSNVSDSISDLLKNISLEKNNKLISLINELYNKFRQSQIGGYVYMIIITSIIILVIKAIKR